MSRVYPRESVHVSTINTRTVSVASTVVIVTIVLVSLLSIAMRGRRKMQYRCVVHSIR